MFGLWIRCLFRTALITVMRGFINANSSEIKLENYLSLVWLLGKRILLESEMEAQEVFRIWEGVLRWVNTVFEFCGFGVDL